MLAEAVLMAGQPQAVAGLAPNDDVSVFADAIAGWTQDTLVVGHMPFVARLVALLLTGDAEPERVCYRPGTVVCLERSEAPGWCLSWMLGPELLVAAAR
jgi:phosphohistidine phosphatase